MTAGPPAGGSAVRTADRVCGAPGRQWRMLTADGVGAAEGLALDEALMADHVRGGPPAPPTLRLYTYRTHVALIGRYQSLDDELDLPACRAGGVEVSRRPTGGGAIIMGADQLGVALAMPPPPDRSPRELLAELARGVIAGLAELGVAGAFRGRNDIEVAGRKVAGLGLYLDADGALLFHASLLADLDVEFMLSVLRVPAVKLAGKAAATVRERVTTVSALLGGHVDAAAVRPAFAAGFARACSAVLVPGEPTPAELARARDLVRTRYAEPGWLGSRAPQPGLRGTATFTTPEGVGRVYVAVRAGALTQVLFTGDFAGGPPAPLVRLESALRWTRLTRPDLVAAAGAAGRSDLVGTALDAVLTAGERASGRETSTPVRPAGSCYYPDPNTEA